MRVNVYVDGFNLYYGIKDTSHKWLNPLALTTRLLPEHTINHIHYFTARITAPPDDPGKPQRQDVFIRALSTIPNLTLHWGQFVSRPRRMPLVSPLADGTTMVEVMRTEEKGSDVNLATWLLLDGLQRKYEMAVVVSNDSDLVEPIRVVRATLGLPVGVFNPQPFQHSSELRKEAIFCRHIHAKAYAACQFPQELSDAKGIFRKPPEW